MKIAYIGIDLMLPVLDAALGCGMELMELFTCQTDNVTEFNSGVIARAKALGAPYTLERITSADLERCAAAGCEAALCAGYYYLVPTGGPLPLINFHPAPLPERRGGWPMPVMLLRGDRLGAMTAHLMSARFDEGDILLREDFEIAPGETLESYMRRANALAPGMVRRIAEDLPGVLAGARPQGRGEYIAMPRSATGRLRRIWPRKRRTGYCAPSMATSASTPGRKNSNSYAPGPIRAPGRRGACL